MEFESTGIGGLTSVRFKPKLDSRGSFRRLFCKEGLAEAGWQWPIAQVNLSHTRLSGTVRGLHYQAPPHTEAKLVVCLKGSAWDVALDLRAESGTFLKWHAQEISAQNNMALLIPRGCAHGFQSLCDEVELLYLHSHPFAADADSGINPFDKRAAIAWPLPVALVSDKDAQRPPLPSNYKGLRL